MTWIANPRLKRSPLVQLQGSYDFLGCTRGGAETTGAGFLWVAKS